MRLHGFDNLVPLSFGGVVQFCFNDIERSSEDISAVVSKIRFEIVPIDLIKDRTDNKMDHHKHNYHKQVKIG